MRAAKAARVAVSKFRLLSDAAARDWGLQIVVLRKGGSFYEPHAKRITISGTSAHTRFAHLVHEIGHHIVNENPHPQGFEDGYTSLKKRQNLSSKIDVLREEFAAWEAGWSYAASHLTRKDLLDFYPSLKRIRRNCLYAHLRAALELGEYEEWE